MKVIYEIGKWNHDPQAESIDWRRFAHDVVELCDRLGVKYVLKADLRRYLE